MFLGHRLHATFTLCITFVNFTLSFRVLVRKTPANGEGVGEGESGTKKMEGLEKAVQRLPSNGLLLP